MANRKLSAGDRVRGVQFGLLYGGMYLSSAATHFRALGLRKLARVCDSMSKVATATLEATEEMGLREKHCAEKPRRARHG